MNKPWSPEPGKNKIIETLQFDIINDKIKVKSKKSRSKKHKSKHSRKMNKDKIKLPQTINHKKTGQKIYTQNKRLTNKTFAKTSKNSDFSLLNMGIADRRFTSDVSVYITNNV